MTLKQKTEENFTVLLRCMDPSHELLGRLRLVPFVKDQVSAIKQKSTDDDKNDALLVLLLEAPEDIQESVINGFISALRSSGQEHVANILNTESDKVPMSDRHHRTLKVKKGQLCQFIDTENGLLDELVGAEIISSADENDIRSMPSYNEKARKLIEVLMRKSEDAFGGFINALNRTGQPHVTYLLTGEESNQSLNEGREAGKVPMSDEHCHNLTANIEQLCQFVDPENGLLDKLISTEIISLADNQCIRSMPGYDEKARRLIEVLMRKSDDAFDVFIKALDKTEQSHVTYILTGEGDSRPLSEEWRDQLREKRSVVVKCIFTYCLVSTLVSKRVFSSHDQHRVEARKTNDEKGETMVDLIGRKSQKAFDDFIQTLRECGHKHVAEYLVGSEVMGRIVRGYSSTHEIAARVAHLSTTDEEDVFEDTKDAESSLREDMQQAFENNNTEVKTVNEVLHLNGIKPSVLDGSIIVQFRCRDHAAILALRELYSSKALNRLFTESFRSKLADEYETLSLSIPDEEFQRHIQLKLMSDEHREALLSSEKLVLDKITVSGDLLDRLSLCERRRQAIEGEETHKQQVKMLLDIVSRQPDSAFTQLLNALKDTNQHEAAAIISGDGKTATDSKALDKLTEDAWNNVDRDLAILLRLIRKAESGYFDAASRNVVTSLHRLREHCSVPTYRTSFTEELESLLHIPEKSVERPTSLHQPTGELYSYRNCQSSGWWSGVVVSALASISEVNLCLARLVLRWVTVSGFNSRFGHLSRYVISHPGQLSLAIPSWVGAMSASQRAMMHRGWGVKAGMVRVWVAGKTV